MARILIVTHSIPRFPASGAPMRDYCLAREMARRHELTFLLPDYGERGRAQAQQLAGFCHVRYFDPGRDMPWSFGKRLLYSVDQRVEVSSVIQLMRPVPETVQGLEPLFPTLRQALADIDWPDLDLLQIEHSHLAPVIDELKVPVPIVVDWHNVYSVMEERQVHSAGNWMARNRARHELWRVRRSERSVARQTDMSVAVSAKDAAAIRDLWAQARVTVTPNGVDCGYFSNPEPEGIEPEALVFTGTMDYEPNEEGVSYFCDRILPQILKYKPNAQLYVVGQRPSPAVLRLPERYPGNVIVTGFVDDVRPYLQRAAISIVPLLNGGGTRLKIMEAMAMHKPVVSTSVGAEGLALVNGQDILIADDPEAFAQAVLSLLDDGESWRRLAGRGRTLAEERFDWKHAAARLEEAWQQTWTGRE